MQKNKERERYCNSRPRGPQFLDSDHELKAYELLAELGIFPILLICNRGYWLPMPATQESK